MTFSLTPGLQAVLEEYRKSCSFDPKTWCDDKCKKLNDYMKKCGLKTCVLNVSGGVDSAVVLGLCRNASKMQDSPIENIVAVCQPIHSSDWALQRGQEVIDKMQATNIIVDQTQFHTSLTEQIESASSIIGSDYTRGQMKSYMRTPVIYYVTQLYTLKGSPAIVMGTGNQDEDGFLLYYAKAGDGVVDVQIISDLHKSQVFKVGEYIGVPESILKAKPSADLWNGQTDENELQFSYDWVELYTGVYLKFNTVEDQAAFKETLDEESLTQFNDWEQKILAVHNRNKHKLLGIINL
ncbi:NAD+ synthase [Bodo saltans virus]|uniref:NAD+ synthase n=1 Tax=Bodo saltans virus TaxID=2024608 RepID=A0A2H4UVY1_9VIRU|nr:NAD+ synthase [Bodo saltans virus]ATZ81037.1 NAD+ synthase [Bodo saltans virus]